MTKILTFLGHYLPGYKAGGPIRTIANMVEHLGDEFCFQIVTSDRDYDDSEAYSGVMADQWQKVGKADVYYASSVKMSFLSLRKLICSTPHDILYLNSFFAYNFTIKPLLLRRLGFIPRRATIVAPRGEFSTGALGFKRLKKQFYLNIAKAVGLYRGITWQASSKHEETDIRRWFGAQATVVIASNLSPLANKTSVTQRVRSKKSGYLKIVFLSRIARKKNLAYCLSMMRNLQGKVQFNIYGPMEDQVYWAECLKSINRLPDNVEVEYCGSVAHEEVSNILNEHDLFFFPTLGENFGHVILESFSAGCPVLISDQTPWRGLKDIGVGWDVPLNDSSKIQGLLQQCVEMSKEEHDKLSQCAREYGALVLQNKDVIAHNRQLFYTAVGKVRS